MFFFINALNASTYRIEAICLTQIISFLEYFPSFNSFLSIYYIEVQILQQLMNLYSFLFKKNDCRKTIICENTATILKKGICRVHALRLF